MNTPINQVTEAIKNQGTTEILTEIKYRDLADLIFILMDEAKDYQGLDDCEELTVYQFTEWLCEMKGSVRLMSTSFQKGR
ncbi:hypothetical protein REC12_20510 [Desulfosporosinus sp. PR]|uniref:hypothetical protein n=1 Tax=Candidatus Desulfosporosinus nitrosoreducens TaxID=3401928 RepID=UPI0027F64246|nr:hypothetical protein [Desulfosporosinus sp. PR]MDQ7095981.1 hypothetical protein [Desulfosporosinus sp. PR]